jgi:uncharacterized protein (DUF1810 family)
MSYDFSHFLDAQEYMYATTLSELKAGKKQNHWIWFIFPQAPKAGMGNLSKKFAIKNREEAQEYLAHTILGKRLIECTEIVLSHRDKTLVEIFGSELDTRKFLSSMTLFSHVDEAGIFKEALGRM